LIGDINPQPLYHIPLICTRIPKRRWYMGRYRKKSTRNFAIDYQGDDMSWKYKSYSYEEYMKAMELHHKYKLGPTKIPEY